MSMEQAAKNIREAQRYVTAELRQERATQQIRVVQSGPTGKDRIEAARVRIEKLAAAEASLCQALLAIEA